VHFLVSATVLEIIITSWDVCAGYCNTTGANNTYIGYQAGHCGTTSSRNFFVGFQAGFGALGSRFVGLVCSH